MYIITYFHVLKHQKSCCLSGWTVYADQIGLCCRGIHYLPFPSLPVHHLLCIDLPPLSLYHTADHALSCVSNFWHNHSWCDRVARRVCSVLLVTCLPLPWWMPCLSVFGGPVTHLPGGGGGGLRGKHDHICYSYPIPRISNIRHFFPKHPQYSATWEGEKWETRKVSLCIYLSLPRRLIRW